MTFLVYLNMSNLTNEFEAKEVSKDLADVIYDRCGSEQCWSSTEILQVPEKEGEN